MRTLVRTMTRIVALALLVLASTAAHAAKKQVDAEAKELHDALASVVSAS